MTKSRYRIAFFAERPISRSIAEKPEGVQPAPQKDDEEKGADDGQRHGQEQVDGIAP